MISTPAMVFRSCSVGAQQQKNRRGLLAKSLSLLVAAVCAWAAARVVAALAWVPQAPSRTGPRAASAASGLSATAAGAVSNLVQAPADTGPLAFEPRDVGSAEQLMLSRMPVGQMITTHCYVAIIEGTVDSQRLREALIWAVVRHPMLRARVVEPQGEKTQDMGPFVHAGKDGRWRFVPCNLSPVEIVDRALEFDDVQGDLDAAWQRDYESALDASVFDLDVGPLWRLRFLRQGGRNAFLFSFVHSLDDQRSGNILLHDILKHMEAEERGAPLADPEPLGFPSSLEEVLLTEDLDVQRLATYALSQAEAGGQPSVFLPSALRSKEREVRKHWMLNPTQPVAKNRPVIPPMVPAEGDTSFLLKEALDPDSLFAPTQRKNLVALRTVAADVVSSLRRMCRQNNVTVSMAIAAAALCATSDIAHDDLDFAYEAYRMLLGVDMRRFAPDGDWTNDTLAFASGALDFTFRLLPKSGEAYRDEHANISLRSRIGGMPFWDLARASKLAVDQWIEKGYATESTRLFDLGMRFLRMDKIIQETAKDPNTIGRAYSVCLSNAGVYGFGPPDGRYGGLRLLSIFFGISSAISGSLVSVSCLTVNGELHMTGHGVAPIVNRTDLSLFMDSIATTLTIAAEAPVPLRGKNVPNVDYPIDPRSGKPWYFPVETPKGKLACPKYEEVKSPSMAQFNVDKYVGIWYELAFHDITQFNGCGCTRFNMTRHGNVIEDMFTVSCPWPWREGVDGPWLPGINANGNRRFNQYTCNMTMFYQPAKPGVMRETGFGQSFDNMVLELWSDPDLVAETGYEYTRAIQFQCLGTEADGITFVGINFLSRVPIVSPARLREMFVRARALGLEPYGSNDMHIVEHEGCRYPVSTDASWMGNRPEWPAIITDKDFGALV
mmetsp:Transcript_107628/g.303110  ORF Transcript_107628/g.303110 Transcript_107628/m.303110 type:complete len:892 (+) Transcript_107628:73-2748(+)